MLLLLVLSSLLVFLLANALHYLYLRYNSRKPWNIKSDNAYQPSISIMVPVHNEEENIEKKLENIRTALYPKEKMEVIIADDASEDRTLANATEVIRHGLGFEVKIVKQESRRGKAATLNGALDHVANPIIIVSDADTFWPPNILEQTMPYLADATVGAVTGQGLNKQSSESWVTRAEDNYLQLASVIRLGESKIHSTIRFEGGFCAFKREAFEKFDCESGSDDSGTALDVIQNNYRTILVPEVVFYTSFPTSIGGKLRIKVRRANQLISLWLKCLKSMFRRELLLPKRVVLPNVFLFLVNPWVFLFLCATAVAHILLFPFSIFSLFLLVSLVGLLVLARNLFLELVVDNLLLAYASLGYLFGRRYVAWQKTKAGSN